MANWESFTRLRDDDPYHAWMMHRRRSESAARGTIPDPGPVCPIIIEALGNAFRDKGEDGPAPTFDDLRGSLEFIRELFNSERLFMSAFDEAHLDRSLNEIDGLSGELNETHDYFRYYLVYDFEDDIFPVPKEDWSKYFSFKYIGAGITDIVRGDRTIQRPPAASPNFDVALTVIDDSFAFLNEEFVHRAPIRGGGVSYKWQFEEIWIQEYEPMFGSFVFNGFRLGNSAVGNGLTNPHGRSDFNLYRDAYRAIDGRDYIPLSLGATSHQQLAFLESHGTHVTSRAMRVFDECNDHGLNLSLTGVALPVQVTENTSGSTLGSYVLAGIRQAMMWNDQYYRKVDSDEVKEVPLVVNFSYGILAGMKDGTSKLNCAISAMIDARNNFLQRRPTALVVPMGNSFDTRSVAEDTLAPGGDPLELDWVVLPDDRTSSFIEVYAYSRGDADLAFEFAPPAGEVDPLTVSTAKKGKDYKTYVWKRDVREEKGEEVYRHAAEWSEWAPEKDSRWKRRVLIALGPTQTFDPAVGDVPHGRWKLRITNASDEDVEILAMVQRDDTPGSYPERGKQSFFDHPDAWQEGASDYDATYFPKSGNYTRLGGPVAYDKTASSFAAIDSKHVFVVGAAKGEHGDGIDPTTGQTDLPIAFEESYYTAKGPRREGKSSCNDGPDYSGLADRSDTSLGIYAAGTYSNIDITLGGSSVAAPELAGLCAAEPKLIVLGTDYFTYYNNTNPAPIKPPDSRFGLIKEAIK
ncbi:MAG: hypothetical protein AAFR73_11605 [Pseudomonadota bacterium]